VNFLGDGNDIVHGRTGRNTVVGGEGVDWVEGGAAPASFRGTASG
jgi:Ca2+-binding RTX toxin-like protein